MIDSNQVKIVNSLISGYCLANPGKHISVYLKHLSNVNGTISSLYKTIENEKIKNTLKGFYFPSNSVVISKRKYTINKEHDQSVFFLIEWGYHLLLFWKHELSQFAQLRQKYENSLFSMQYAIAYKTLLCIEKEFGVSLWLFAQYYLISFLWDSTEIAEKVASIKAFLGSDHLINAILTYYEKMMNDNISYDDYHEDYTQFIKGLSENPFRDYCIQKLGINCTKSIQGIKATLIFDEQISAVDYYESYIDCIQNLVHIDRYRLFIKNICKTLYKNISDPRFRNLLITYGIFPNTKDFELPNNIAMELYTQGKYNQLVEYYQKIETNQRADFELSVLMAKTGYNVNGLSMYYPSFWAAVQAIYYSRDNQQSIEIICKFLKRFSVTSWKNKILSFMSRKLCFPAPNHIYSLSLINDLYLSPLFYICIPNKASQTQYLNMFKAVAPATAALHIYTLTGIISDDEKSLIAPSRFDYYQIDRYFVMGYYENCINLCNRLIAMLPTTVYNYYYEKITRLIYLCYINVGKWENAAAIYADNYINNYGIVRRMPLDSLIPCIDDPDDDGILQSINRVIVLKAYYRNDDKEIISAYFDYLESKQCRTINDFIDSLKAKDTISSREKFFLYRVCTESLLILDYRSTEKNNATYLRISVLRFLAEYDKENIKLYYDEMNDHYKELLLQERRQLFNHTRIYIDKEKLLVYLHEKIGQEFTQYARIQEIKKLFNSSESELISEHPYAQLTLYSFFITIIDQIKQAYLFDSPYSLEDFLSTRIRHVFCKDTLKKAFDEQHLFSKKQQDSSEEYLVNEYWHDKANAKDYGIIQHNLAIFSKAIDEKIQEVRDSWIRIKKEDNNGLFDYSDFTNDFLDHTEINLEKVLDSNHQFFIAVIDALDSRTDIILSKIRQRIKNELKPFYADALVNLEIGIRQSVLSTKWKADILRRIETSKATSLQDIDRFEDVFYLRYENYPDFIMSDVIDFCCAVERDISIDFDKVQIKKSIHTHHHFNGVLFPYLVDILSILLHNAVEHSEFIEKGQLCIDVSIYPVDEYKQNIDANYFDSFGSDSIVVIIQNNLASSVDTDKLAQKTESILDDLRDKKMHERSKLVNGSGLYKIGRTLYYNMNVPSLIFTKINHSSFSIGIAMDLASYVRRNRIENTLY